MLLFCKIELWDFDQINKRTFIKIKYHIYVPKNVSKLTHMKRSDLEFKMILLIKKCYRPKTIILSIIYIFVKHGMCLCMNKFKIMENTSPKSVDLVPWVMILLEGQMRNGMGWYRKEERDPM